MKTKTFKIGECCIGGIMVIEIYKNLVRCIARDWNTKTIVQEKSFPVTEGFGISVDPSPSADHWQIDNYLTEMSTSYHASKAIDWIKQHVKLD